MWAFPFEVIKCFLFVVFRFLSDDQSLYSGVPSYGSYIASSVVDSGKFLFSKGKHLFKPIKGCSTTTTGGLLKSIAQKQVNEIVAQALDEFRAQVQGLFCLVFFPCCFLFIKSKRYFHRKSFF